MYQLVAAGRRPLAVLLLATVTACGSSHAPAPTPAPAATSKSGTASSTAHSHSSQLPVFEAFDRAVAQGTRTRTGTPGPKYWQQWADYRLEAELNPVSKRLTGKGKITYYNRSPDTLPVVYVQLLQNIFAPGARHNTNVPWSVEGIDLARVAAQGQDLARQEGEAPGYQVNGTVMRIRLPKPIVPGGSAG